MFYLLNSDLTKQIYAFLRHPSLPGLPERAGGAAGVALKVLAEGGGVFETIIHGNVADGAHAGEEGLLNAADKDTVDELLGALAGQLRADPVQITGRNAQLPGIVLRVSPMRKGAAQNEADEPVQVLLPFASARRHWHKAPLGVESIAESEQ